MSITNDIIDYITRTIPQYSDILSTNFNITSYTVDDINNTATIQTDGDHGLLANYYVFIKGVKYCYNISNIKNTTFSINRVQTTGFEITFNNKLAFQNETIVDLIGFNAPNTNLNTEFVVYKTSLTDTGQTVISGLFKNGQTPTIDLTNEGEVCIEITDDVFVEPSALEEKNLGTNAFISGSYNGLKVVKEVIDATTFKIDLATNTNTLRPEYTSNINTTNALCKTRLMILGVNDVNSEDTINRHISDMTENSIQSVLLISRDSSEFGRQGNALANQDITFSTGIDRIEKNINFIAKLVFRVERKDYGTRGHYVLANQSNDIADNLDDIFQFIMSRYFTSFQVFFNNLSSVERIYQGFYTNISSIDDVADVENGVFKTVSFNFKISRFMFEYGKFEINKVGVPFQDITLQITDEDGKVSSISTD